MIDWVETLKTVGTITSVGGVIILGVLAIIGVFDKAGKDREKQGDERDEKLIKILTETVSVLEKEVNKLKEQQNTNIADINKLRGENDLMTRIFQGRDPQAVEFQTRGLEAIKKTDVIIEVVTETNKNVEKLYKAIEKHMAQLEKKA